MELPTYMYDPCGPLIALNTPYNVWVIRATSKSRYREVEIEVAQLVEHSYVKRETRGSTPGLGQHFSATVI